MDTLRSFLAVADLGGVTHAAESLGRSQPAISLQIRKLEGLLDSQLFHRSGQRLSLSDAGQRLYPLAQRVINLNDEILSDFVQPRITGLIRFGVPSEFATTLLPRILGRFSQAYPQVSLEITSDLSRNLLRASSDRYDLILALRDPGKGNARHLVQEDELVWTSASYQTGEDAIALIAAPEPCVYRSRALRQLEEAGREYRIVYTNSDLTGIRAALDEGLGITVLARSAVPRGLRILGPGEGLPALGKVGIHLVYDRRKTAPAISRLAGFVAAGLAQARAGDT